MLAQLGPGDQHLGQRDVVVRDEHHFQQVADLGVVVDDGADGGDEADDLLGSDVGRGRLSAKDDGARDELGLSVVQVKREGSGK